MACYIDISQLIEHPDHQIHARTNFPLTTEFDSSFRSANICSVRSSLTKKSGNLIVEADAKVIIEASCLQCDKTVKHRVVASFSEIVCMDSVLISEKRLDIEPLVRDAIDLNLPQKTLCNNNCEGICGKCGTNLNYNTCLCRSENILDRWLPFKKLKFNNIFAGEV